MLPTNEFCPKEKLFEKITEAEIDAVYYNNLVGNHTLKAMEGIIEDLQLIVSEWDDKATLVPFGSYVNGLMLK